MSGFVVREQAKASLALATKEADAREAKALNALKALGVTAEADDAAPKLPKRNLKAALQRASAKASLATSLSRTVATDLYGDAAGPPDRPVATDVGVDRLTLSWKRPWHVGDVGVEIKGYRVWVQWGGDSGWLNQCADTGTAEPAYECTDLRPNTWYEFKVAALTAAGEGVHSPVSRPYRTQRAARLAKDIERAKASLVRAEDSAAEQRDHLARFTRRQVMRAGMLDGPAQVRARKEGKALRRTVQNVELKLREARARLDELLGQQEEEEMARAIRAEQEAKDAQVYTEGGRKGLATQGTYGDGYGGGTGYGGSTGRRDSVRRGGWARLGALRSLGRLYAGESDSDDAGDGDDDGGEDRGRYYPEWDKDAAHEMLLRALMRNVLTDGDQTKWRYFQLALNRVRSGVTHNVLSRECFDDDTQLEQLALLFARFDADHDGVLDWDDFCRVMLLVGSRVGKTYAENDLKQMWAKVDVNGDGMIDLNEFCRMAWSGYALAGAEPAPWPQPKEDDEWEYDDEFVATDRTASELTFLDEDAALELEGEDFDAIDLDTERERRGSRRSGERRSSRK